MLHGGMYGRGRKKAAPKPEGAPRAAPRRLEERGFQDLVDLLDEEFSFNVRARAVLAGKGIAHCVTCGKPGGLGDLDCGHYITRAIHITRWLRINTGPQCPKCNRFMNGMAHVFRAYLVVIHGEARIKALEEKAFDTGWRESSEGLIAKITELRGENRQLRKDLKCLP